MPNETWNDLLARDQARRNNSVRPATAAEVAQQATQAKRQAIASAYGGWTGGSSSGGTGGYDRIRWIRDYRADPNNRVSVGHAPGLRESVDEFRRRFPNWEAGDVVPFYSPGNAPMVMNGSKGVNGLPLDMFLGSLAADLKLNRPKADGSGRAGALTQAYQQWLRDVKALTHSLMGTVDRFNAVPFAVECGTTWDELDKVQAFDETDDLLKDLAQEEGE